MNWINRHNPFFVFIEWWDRDTRKMVFIFWKYWVLRLINAPDINLAQIEWSKLRYYV